MRFLSLCILIVALLFSTELSAKNSIYTNLSYFFQDAEADLPLLKVYERNVEELVKDLRQFDQDSKKKRIDRISKAVEKKFFKLHNNEADMADFFVSGLHNSISARAIQAIILVELDIPYRLAENGGGLQLIAYPQSEYIILEYDTKSAYLTWTEETKTRAINDLISMAVITKSQANNYGFGLIDKHFNTTNRITLQELAGLDLMKKGILAIEGGEYLKATELLTIGNDNYADNRFGYLKYGAMDLAVEDMTYDNVLIMDYMLQMYDLTRKKAVLDRLKSNLTHVYYIALNERRDFEFSDSTKSLVLKKLKRDGDKNLIMSSFLSNDMYYYFKKGERDKAFDSAAEGLAYNPKNLEIQNVFGGLLIGYLFYDIAWLNDDLEMTTIVDTLAYYTTTYPFLEESEDIKGFMILIICEQVAEAFNSNMEKEGLYALPELDQLLKDYDYEDEELNEEIAGSYSDIAIYYYREKQYALAMEWVEKAVKLFPDSEYINQRKKNIEAKL
ncbi:MAG: hypothetical protein GQ574_11915 [Crocinitomix sp.]|nr:hypothetical protein [Crocinitomix sp.]